jgi:hypothetical protein
MTRYAKRKLKYSLNENFNLLPYVEWDRFVTLTGAQAECNRNYSAILATLQITSYVHSRNSS